MPLFFGTAGDISGVRRAFTLDAPSRASLDTQLSRQGLYPLQVECIQRGVTSEAFWRNLIEGEVSRRTLIGFTRSLSVMLASSIPLLDVLSSVTAREMDPDAREVFAALSRLVESGTPFHEALSQYPGVFPSYFVHSAQAGERSASLPAVLERLAEDLEFQREMFSQFVAALVYPAILALATVGLFFTSVFFVLPRLAAFYEGMGIPFPAYTTALLSTLDFARTNAGLLAVAGLLAAYRLVSEYRTEEGRARFDRLVSRLPLLGRQVRAFRVGMAVRNLALMKESGMPLPESLEIIAAGQASPELARSLELVRRYLEYGNPPSLAFEGAKLLGSDDLRMLRAGEESDRLPFALRRIAHERDREMRDIATTVQNLLPVLLLICAGGIVMALMVAVLLPTIEMLKQVQ